MIKVKDIKEMLALYGHAIPELEQLIAGKEDDQALDLIDRNDYIASVLWQREDIKVVLVDNEIDASEENVDKVIDKLGEGLKDCSSGFEYIDYVVTSLFDTSEKILDKILIRMFGDIDKPNQ
jgi:hypothetical protein